MEDYTVTMELDCRGLKCPMPVIKTRQAILQLKSGDVLKMTASDPGSINDINAWARRTGNTLAREEHSGREFVFVIIKS